MAEWIPDLAGVELEKRMEARDVPEEDRDEVRRFAEFLRWRKDKQAGKTLEPMSEEMKAWQSASSAGIGGDCVLPVEAFASAVQARMIHEQRKECDLLQEYAALLRHVVGNPWRRWSAAADPGRPPSLDWLKHCTRERIVPSPYTTRSWTSTR